MRPLNKMFSSRIACVILTTLMLFTMVVPVAAVNDLGVTYSAEFDSATLTVSEEEQVVVLEITTNKTVAIDAITAQLKCPTGFAMVKAENADLGFTAGNYNVNNGIINYYSPTGDNIDTDLLATITIKVPADAPAGEYEFEFEISMISSDWGTAWEEGACVSATLSIVAAEEPSCSHPDKTATYFANGNGTHDVTYTCDCGEDLSDLDEFMVPCYDNDGDNHCDACEFNMCEHDYQGSYSSNDDGTHYATYTCDDCGDTFGVPETCFDDDNNKFCDGCRYNMCEHGDFWYSRYEEELYHDIACGFCDAIVEEYVPCEDNDGDNSCDYCMRTIHVCSATTIPGQANTCEADGWWDYYQCEECGTYYANEVCTIKIDDIESWKQNDGKIPTRGHLYRYDCDKICGVCGKETRPGAEHIYLYECDQKCSICGVTTNPDADHFDENADHFCDYNCGAIVSECHDDNDDHICDYEGCKDILSPCKPEKADGKAATCYEDGWDDYYQCYCGKYYADKDGEQEIADIVAWQKNDGKIAGGHAWGEPEYKDNEDGTHTAHYTCGNQCEEPKSDDPEEHEFAEGRCIFCGAKVPVYTLTVLGWHGEVLDTFDLEAGTNLMDAVKDIEIPVIYEYGEKLEFSHWGMDDGSSAMEDHHVMPESPLTIFPSALWTGWTETEDGWCFEIRSEIQKTGWTKIDKSTYTENEVGSDWFYLDPRTGARAEGITRVPYPTAPINGITYTANASDKAYAESHSGSKYTDATTAVFVFGEEGEFTPDTGRIGNRYAVNGMIGWHVGLVQIGDGYYYFKGDESGNGNIMATGNVYASRNNTSLAIQLGGIYTFGNDGKMCMYDGIVAIGGDYYYYENNRLAIAAGLIEIDGDYYYVRSNGKLVANREYWVATTNGLISAGLYTFDANGKLVVEEADPEMNGIVVIDGEYFYYENGVKKVGAGVLEMIDENGEAYLIYVRSNGQLATGIYWPTNRNGLLESGGYDWGTNGRYYPGK